MGKEHADNPQMFALLCFVLSLIMSPQKVLVNSVILGLIVETCRVSVASATVRVCFATYVRRCGVAGHGRGLKLLTPGWATSHCCKPQQGFTKWYVVCPTAAMETKSGRL